MPFFDEQPPRRSKPKRRRLRRDDDEERPTLWVPGYLAEDVVLAVSDQAAIVMHGVACYPRGFAFSLEAISRYEVTLDDETEEDMDSPFPFALWRPSRSASGQFGIQYSDGRRATLGERRFMARGKRSNDAITITPGGGGGGSGHWRHDVWVQPLPPPGSVTFAVEWRTKGIEETLHEIEGERFREAAQRATRVFPRQARAVDQRAIPDSGT